MKSTYSAKSIALYFATAAILIFARNLDATLDFIPDAIASDPTTQKVEHSKSETSDELAKKAEQAIKSGRLLEAAQLYNNAAAISLAGPASLKRDFQLLEAEALFRHGNDIGDNIALHKALDAYTKLRETIDKSASPREWALATSDIANTLAVLAVREPDAKFAKRATATFDEVHSTFNRILDSTALAKSSVDYANALTNIGKRQADEAMLDSAIAEAERALANVSRQSSPEIWAAAKASLGYALQNYAQRNSDAHMNNRAIDALNDAMTVYTREDNPHRWAISSARLGNCLRSKAGWEADQATLLSAVSMYSRAMEALDANRFPLEWAQVELDMGNAFIDLARYQNGEFFLEQAQLAFQNALSKRKKEVVPLEWAMTQNNLGAVYLDLASRETGTTMLRRALAQFQLAATASSQKGAALDWALVQMNLGKTLGGVWNLEKQKRAEEFEDGKRALMTVQRDSKIPMQYGDQIAAHEALHKKMVSIEMLDESIESIRNAETVYDFKTKPSLWTATQYQLAFWMNLRGEALEDTNAMAEAIEVYSNLTAKMDMHKNPGYWATIMLEYGNAVFSLGMWTKNRDHVLKAIEIHKTAVETAQSDRLRATLYADMARSFEQLAGDETGIQSLQDAYAAYENAMKYTDFQEHPQSYQRYRTDADKLAVEIKKRGG